MFDTVNKKSFLELIDVVREINDSISKSVDINKEIIKSLVKAWEHIEELEEKIKALEEQNATKISH